MSAIVNSVSFEFTNSELASSLLPDYGVKLAAELELASRLRAAQFLVTQRPWLGN